MIRGVCNRLDKMVSMAMKLASDGHGPVLDPEAVRQAFAVRDLGFDTVPLTWVVYKLCVEVPKAAT